MEDVGKGRKLILGVKHNGCAVGCLPSGCGFESRYSRQTKGTKMKYLVITDMGHRSGEAYRIVESDNVDEVYSQALAISTGIAVRVALALDLSVSEAIDSIRINVVEATEGELKEFE